MERPIAGVDRADDDCWERATAGVDRAEDNCWEWEKPGVDSGTNRCGGYQSSFEYFVACLISLQMS